MKLSTVLQVYSYQLFDKKKSHTVCGYIEGLSEDEVRSNLKKKYKFDKETLEIQIKKTLNIDDISTHNNKYSHIWDNKSKFTAIHVPKGALKKALKKEAIDVSKGKQQNFLQEKTDKIIEKEEFKSFTLDYRKVIEFEKNLSQKKMDVLSRRYNSVVDHLTNGYDRLNLELEGLLVKMFSKEFNKNDQERLGKLKLKIDSFSSKSEKISKHLQNNYKGDVSNVKKIVKKIFTLSNILYQAKMGNVPEEIRLKASDKREFNERAQAIKIAKKIEKVRKKKRYFENIHKTLKTEDEKEKNSANIKILDNVLKKLKENVLVLKYYPEVVSNENVIDYEKEAADFEKELEDQLSFMEKVIKFLNLKKKLEEFKKEFLGGGSKKFFSALKNKHLGRSYIDIHAKDVADDIGGELFTIHEKKMKTRFSFELTQKQVKKKDDKSQVTVEGVIESGNIFVDFFNFLNEFIVDISPIKTKELAVFYRILAVLVDAGIPLIRSLNQMVEQTQNLKLKKIIYKLRVTIEQGASLSKSMTMYPDVFNDSVIGMVKSGEASGTLPKTLKQIASTIEKSAALVSKVKGAMIYPLILIIVLVGVVVAILVLVLPKLMPLFENSELPATTKTLIAVSDFLKNYWYVAIMIPFVFWMAFKKFTSTYEGKFYWDYMKLKIPIFGKLSQKLSLAKFSRSINSLLSSGLPIIKALKMNAESVGNEVYKVQILGIAEAVKQGHTIADSIENNVLFPPMVTNMIRVGEEAAAIGDMSGRIANFYEDEVDEMVKNLSTLMEPIIIVSLAVVVGFIMMAIMQPILAITDNIGK